MSGRALRTALFYAGLLPFLLPLVLLLLRSRLETVYLFVGIMGGYLGLLMAPKAERLGEANFALGMVFFLGSPALAAFLPQSRGFGGFMTLWLLACCFAHFFRAYKVDVNWSLVIALWCGVLLLNLIFLLLF